MIVGFVCFRFTNLLIKIKNANKPYEFEQGTKTIEQTVKVQCFFLPSHSFPVKNNRLFY